jgi:hypothetical protein
VEARHFEIGNTHALLAKMICKATIVADQNCAQSLLCQPQSFLTRDQSFASPSTARNHDAALTRKEVENHGLLSSQIDTILLFLMEPSGKERPRRRNTREDLTNHLDSLSPDFARSPFLIAFSGPVSEDTICPLCQILHIVTVTYDLDGCIGPQ